VATVTTGQIYWGSVPFICIQLFMVAMVMLFPGLVTHYKSEASQVDPSTVEINIDSTYGNGVYGSDAYGGDAAEAFK